MILKQPFIRRFIKPTNPRNQYQQYIKEIQKDVEGRRLDVRLQLDEKINNYLNNKNPNNKKEVMDFIKSQPKLDQQRLKRRFNDSKKIPENIQDKRYWMQLLGLNPEARAEVFWDRYKDLNKNEQVELVKQSRKIPGIRTSEFNKRFRQLKQGSQ